MKATVEITIRLVQARKDIDIIPVNDLYGERQL